MTGRDAGDGEAGVTPAQLRAARIAVSAGFFAFGATFALWAVHIPLIVDRLTIDPAQLGLALLVVGLGGVVSQPSTGWLVGRIGSRLATAVSLPVCIASVMLPILAPDTPLLFAGGIAFGIATGAANVAVNTQASEVETLRRRPTMSSFHGFFSLGAFAGAAAGGGLVGAGLSGGSGAAGVVVLLIAGFAFASRYLLAASVRAPDSEAMPAGGVALSMALVVLAALVFVSNMVEGSVTDWSALYLVTVRGFSEAQAATGFALFQLGMTACRLGGHVVIGRVGERVVVAGGGIFTALGMLAVVLAPLPWLSPLGFVLVALGVANTVPVMIGVASRVAGASPAAGVATVATGALLGLLAGPPLIGFVAHAYGLPLALGCLSAAGLAVAVGASRFPWPALAADTRPQRAP